jgi:predicted ATPase
MRLLRLEIHNYKSLRNVAIEPTPLAVLVGPNAAGKTNLADAIDFLGHAYAWGLEKAVAYKGGYESICFRDVRRSQDPLRFRVVIEIPWNSLGFTWLGLQTHEFSSVQADHCFEFKATSRRIQPSYKVVSEHVVFSGKVEGGALHEILSATRKGGEVESHGLEVDSKQESSAWRAVLDDTLRGPFEHFKQGLREGRRGSDFMVSVLPRINWETNFGPLLGSLRVFQLDPRSCREAGVPTPNPDLERSGRNLPVALDHLKKISPKAFAAVLGIARRVMPSLEDIETDWTHRRTVALFLKERGVKRPWTSEDVSDGTIQTLALLVATFDPRTSLVVIEEPENSVHPWTLRVLTMAFRLAAEVKQIILTTHSPILLDQLKPEEVWVVQKPGTETKIDPLLSLDPSLKESWGQGKFTLSEYLDSGAVPEAVPAVNS